MRVLATSKPAVKFGFILGDNITHFSYDANTNIETVSKIIPELTPDSDQIDVTIDVLKSPILRDSSTEKIGIVSPEHIDFLRNEIIRLSSK